MATVLMFRRSLQKFLIAKNYSTTAGHNILQHGDPKQIEAACKMWKNLTLYAVPIAIFLSGLNAYMLHEEPAPPEFIPYEHLRIRTKPFPWGDGNHSLFHNPHVNPLPTGYEH